MADVLPLPVPRAQRVPRGTHIEVDVGGTVFRRPKTETHIDFLCDLLKETLGRDWAAKQFALPEQRRHVIMRWWRSLCELQERSAPRGHVPGQWYSVTPSGDAMEFVALADDVYRLRLVRALRPSMVNRLRNHAEFQGARYECAVAAGFVKAGFQIRWLGGEGVHAEFVATHRTTGECITIETKSRRRRATLNESGEPLDRDGLRADVSQLYDRALLQCPAQGSFGVFIDVNLPHESASDRARIPWEDDLRRFVEQRERVPAEETCAVFTNFGWHYSGDGRARGARSVFTFPQRTRCPLKHAGTYVAVLQAVDAFGQILSVE